LPRQGLIQYTAISVELSQWELTRQRWNA